MSSLITLSSHDLMVWLGSFWWPFIRLAAFLWALPVIDSPTVPPRVRILLAAMLALLIASTRIDIPAIDPFSIASAVVSLEQVCFGVIMGLSIRVLFSAFTISGQILSMQMGLSMAVMMDPGSGQTPLLGQLFWLMSALLFFAFDGHLISLAIMVEGFSLWPVGVSLYELNLSLIVNLFGWMLVTGLMIALPAIIAMLLVNITFGIATRAAPSLNLFALGFPMTLVMGFVSILLTIQQFGRYFFTLSEEVLTTMRLVMG